MDEYARFARLYDPIVGPPLRPLHRAMVRELKRRGCGSVIDLCCGTGLFLGMAAESGLAAFGMDLSPDMLAVAREKYPSLNLIEGDATATPHPDNHFDAATISFGLHEKPDEIARAIFREALRLTRPGGVVLVADYRRPESGGLLSGWGIRLVERLAGRDHFTSFKAYMAQGGSEGFLKSEGVAFELVRTSMSGWAGLFAIPK